MSLCHFTSASTPNPNLNPRFNSLFVDTVLTAGSIVDAGGQVKAIKTLAAGTASQSLAVADSGKLIVVPTVSQATTLTLPTVATSAGVTYKLLFQTAAPGSGKTFTISKNSGDGAIMLGTLQTGPVSAPLQIAMNSGLSNIVRSASAGVAGETIDLFCDGTYWYASGLSTGTVPWSVS